MTLKDLKAKCKQYNLKGYSNKNKEELEKMVEMHEIAMEAIKLEKEGERMAQNLGAASAGNNNKGGNMGKKKAHVEADERLKALMGGETATINVTPESQEVLDEIKAELKRLPKVVYRYNPTEMAPVEGLRIVPVLREGMISCELHKDTFKIATSNPWYLATVEGRVKAFILEFSGDTDTKKEIVRAAVNRVFANSKKKRGVHEFLFGKTADQSKSLFFAATRQELVNIIGEDPSVKKPVNKIGMPTFSNNILKLVSSDIEEIRFRVVDPRLMNYGRNPNDGACYIDNIKFYYEEYINAKDQAAGKRPSLVVLDEAQMRLSGWNGKEAYPVLKDDCWMPTFFGYAKQFCEANGLKLGECHGAIDIESLKSNPNGLKHGSVLTVRIEDLRWANKASEEGTNKVGTQLQCCNPEFSEAILNESREGMGKDKFGHLIEPGLRVKGEMFKRFLTFEAEAVAYVLRATESMADSPLQNIKCLSFSIPKIKDKNGKWVYAPNDPKAIPVSPAYQSVFNQLCARGWAAYSNDVVRAKVGNVSIHFCPDPSGLVDKLEQQIYDETGEIVSLCIVPKSKTFMKDYDNHKYFSGGRAPFVGPASTSGLLAIRTDDEGNYITDIEKLRNREGKLVTTTKSGIMVSSKGIKMKDGTWVTSCIESFNGDFDGDGAIAIFSNVAESPVFRIAKEMPGVEGDKAKPEPLGDEEFKDALITAYNSQIESQKAIGMMDNFRKLLYATRRFMNGKTVMINGKERVCKPIPASIGHVIAAICEEMIQGKKHVITADSVSQIRKKLIKQYAPNGELPSGDDRPLQYLLLHNSLGLTESDDQHVNHEILLRTLCNIVNEYNRRGVHELDCYKELWYGMKGCSIEVNHEDSQYWKDACEMLWARLLKENEADRSTLTNPMFPKKVSESTLQRVISMGDFINGNGSLNMMAKSEDGTLIDDPFEVWKKDFTKFPGFRWLSKQYNNIKDNEERQAKYSELFGHVEEFIKTWLDNVCGINEERKGVMLRILAIYLGIIGFGTGFSQENQQTYSLPGHSFWCLGSWPEGKDALNWVAKRVHPNNPFLKDVE